MVLHVVRRKDTGSLQIAGIVERPDGSKMRVRRAPRSADPIAALEEARDIERRLLGLLPSIEVLRAKLETIVLLAEGGNVRALAQIAKIGDEALALLNHG